MDLRQKLFTLLCTLGTLPLAGGAFALGGAETYEQKCAICHGTQGEGVEGLYNLALEGDSTIGELAERIDTTMPEEDPDACVGDEAREVAEYIFHAFYSVEARRKSGKLRAPRVELARLTVDQYRNSVSDLLGSFTPSPRPGAEGGEGGLRGQYYQSDGMSKTDKLKLERIDPQINFDFGGKAPDENIDAEQFAIVWRGSLMAHATGYHEFRIETPNGVRLYLNADRKRRHGKMRDDSSEAVQSRLIDGWVSNGENRVLTGKIYLLAGRRYPIRLDFFKYKEPKARLRLEWKPPHGIATVMDEHTLSPLPAKRTFCVETPFPADDRSVGYERGRSVSPEWYAATTNGALATAEEVMNRLSLLTRDYRGDDETRVLAKFMQEFASRAYRRPLTDTETQLFGQELFANDTPESALQRGLLLVLTSPHFLYIDVPADVAHDAQHKQAARLAFALWDSLPDEELRKAARQGELTNQEQLAYHARRMLKDPRAKTKTQKVFSHWLELEERDLAKDEKLYPEFNEAIIADLRRSLELFVDQVIWSERSDYRELLQADYLLLNDRLQALYASGSMSPAETGFVKCDAKSDGRCGILTHPYLLSAFAYHNNTSPIHRGVFLTRNIVGRPLKPPPVAVAFEDSEFAPHLTMREKVTELTRDQACMSCHEVINPLGFALEGYDAVGRLQTRTGDKPVDTKSEYKDADGSTHPIASARDIADFAIASPAAHRAFVTQVFHNTVRQPPAAYGPELLDELSEGFAADEFNIQRLLIRIAVVAAMHNSPSSTATTHSEGAQP